MFLVDIGNFDIMTRSFLCYFARFWNFGPRGRLLGMAQNVVRHMIMSPSLLYLFDSCWSGQEKNKADINPRVTTQDDIVF